MAGRERGQALSDGKGLDEAEERAEMRESKGGELLALITCSTISAT